MTVIQARYGGGASISCCLETSLMSVGFFCVCSLKAKTTQPQPVSGWDFIKYQPLRKDNLILLLHVIYLTLNLATLPVSLLKCPGLTDADISQTSLLTSDMPLQTKHRCISVFMSQI